LVKFGWPFAAGRYLNHRYREYLDRLEDNPDFEMANPLDAPFCMWQTETDLHFEAKAALAPLVNAMS
jgi:hypothetical protein